MQSTFVYEQLMTLAVTIVLGVCIGIGFDALSVFRQFVRLTRFLQYLIDFLYCVMMTVVVFVVLVANNWGEVRAYVFLGIGIGVILYLLILHRLIRKLMVKIAEMIRAAIGFIARPVCWLFRKTVLFVNFNRRVFFGGVHAGKRTAKKIKAKFHRKKKE